MTDHHDHDHHDDHGEHHVHVIPLVPMLATLGALLFLTILTVVTAKGMYFGNEINLVIALIIASIKGVLVAAFFMHLWWDKRLNTVIVVSTMFAVVLFIGLTMMDTLTRGMADEWEEGEIIVGGGAPSRDATTGKFLSRKGNYANPMYNDVGVAGESILVKAQRNYEAKHAHESDGHDDHGDDGHGDH